MNVKLKKINQFLKLFTFSTLGAMSLNAFSQDINTATIDWVKTNSRSPEQYVIDKFRQYDVIFLGESHLVKENLLFVQGLIPQLYQNGIYQIGMEFGATEVQEELDQLVMAPVYDEEKARSIMFTYNVTWGFQEYLDIYKAAWKLNQTLPEGTRKFRILNLSYIFNWEKFNGERTPESMQLVFNKGTVDKFRAAIIEKEIIHKQEKILALVGTPHAYTRYGSPYFKYNGEQFCDFDFDWLGNRLYQKFPGQVFSIMLHQAFTQKENGRYFLISPAEGAIEKLMAGNGQKPIGFDLINTPVGKLTDRSINSMCYENFTLEQLFDGYIFLEPLRDLEGCTVIGDFVHEGNFENALKNFPDPDWHEKVTTLADIKKFMHNISGQISEQYKGL